MTKNTSFSKAYTFTVSITTQKGHSETSTLKSVLEKLRPFVDKNVSSVWTEAQNGERCKGVLVWTKPMCDLPRWLEPNTPLLWKRKSRRSSQLFIFALGPDRFSHGKSKWIIGAQRSNIYSSLTCWSGSLTDPLQRHYVMSVHQDFALAVCKASKSLGKGDWRLFTPEGRMRTWDNFISLAKHRIIYGLELISGSYKPKYVI